MQDSPFLPTLRDICETRAAFPPDLVRRTSLLLHERLSGLCGAEVYVKHEEEQPIRSYKIRGAYAKIASLTKEERARGIVCASAGNHAQGVAAACARFRCPATVFMPVNTPRQKVEATRRRGASVELRGASFDEAAALALAFAAERDAVFVHPFDDPEVIAGQGTVALEIAEQMGSMRNRLRCVVLPVGGGGLLAGTVLALEDLPSDVTIVGAEPEGAASMAASVRAGRPVTLSRVDPFVDGAAVARPGDRTFAVVADAVRKGRVRLTTVSNEALCAAMVDLLQMDGQLTEPAGALSIAALNDVMRDARGGAVACVLSGNNFDVRRMPDVLRRVREWPAAAETVPLAAPVRV